MLRFIASALLCPLTIAAAGCDSTPPEALVSQAFAAPAEAPSYAPPKGYQSSVSPTAVEDTVVEYE